MHYLNQHAQMYHTNNYCVCSQFFGLTVNFYTAEMKVKV